MPSPVFQIYKILYDHYGPQAWWPGDSPFEIIVGAVLTQNTAWSNVERAIANLKHAKMLNAHAIVRSRHSTLATLLKPSGYFNIKARRLRNVCDWYLAQGSYDGLSEQPTKELRSSLLTVNGVGFETADDIVLYAFERPVFVIDAYTRRLFRRLQMIQGDESYEVLRLFFESHLTLLKGRVRIFNEYHALIVHHAKHFCKTRPLCEDCCLQSQCSQQI